MMSEEQVEQLRALEEEVLALQRTAMSLLARADAAHERLLEILHRELAGPLA